MMQHKIKLNFTSNLGINSDHCKIIIIPNTYNNLMRYMLLLSVLQKCLKHYWFFQLNHIQKEKHLNTCTKT